MGKSRIACTVEGPRDTHEWVHPCVDADLKRGVFVEDVFEDLKFTIIHLTEEELLIRIENINVVFVNALRRIMISEVESCAVETVHVYQNTGILQDEVVAHRIGLCPFKVDSQELIYRTANEELDERNALKYQLKTGVITKKDYNPDTQAYHVYSGHLKWVPLSDRQKEKYKDCPPRPVYENVLITKMKEGQEIELECYVERGIGRTHAKWNPVATASYKLQPDIVIKDLSKPEHQELVEICPMKVFDIEDGAAKATRSMDCTTCRVCIERFPDRVMLFKERSNYLFRVESTGAMPPEVIFRRAIGVLKEKCVKIREILAGQT